MAKIPRWKWDRDKPPTYKPPTVKTQEDIIRETKWEQTKGVIEKGKQFDITLKTIKKIDRRIRELKSQSKDIDPKAQYTYEGKIITGKQAQTILQSHINELRHAKTETAGYGIDALKGIEQTLQFDIVKQMREYPKGTTFVETKEGYEVKIPEKWYPFDPLDPSKKEIREEYYAHQRELDTISTTTKTIRETTGHFLAGFGSADYLYATLTGDEKTKKSISKRKGRNRLFN